MVKKINHRLYWPVLAAAIAGVALAGCAGVQKNANLESAKTAYGKAAGNPKIVANAPVALYEAEKELNRAEEAWEKTEDRKKVAHLSYLAQKKIAIAAAIAERRQAEDEVEKLAEERGKELLQSRTRELESARQQARKVAEARGLEAEQARQEAMRAKELAEAKTKETELARREKLEAAMRLQELEKELVEMKAKKTDRGLVLTLEGVLFEFNKSDLKPGARRNLGKLATFLRNNPDRKIMIEGHTDSLGSESYNLVLSKQRADAVQDFLVQAGVTADRLESRGLGESYPVASNKSEAGRQQNRRVEIIVLDEKQ
jgi:outer membrane protein OmpA-like peptidoglycan-associated protein